MNIDYDALVSFQLDTGCAIWQSLKSMIAEKCRLTAHCKRMTMRQVLKVQGLN